MFRNPYNRVPLEDPLDGRPFPPRTLPGTDPRSITAYSFLSQGGLLGALLDHKDDSASASFDLDREVAILGREEDDEDEDDGAIDHDDDDDDDDNSELDDNVSRPSSESPPGYMAMASMKMIDPRTIFIKGAIALSDLGRSPAPVDCPMCGARQMTITRHQAGRVTLCLGASLFMTTLCFCWVPFMVPETKDVVHLCRNCGVTLATVEKAGGVVVHLKTESSTANR